MYPPDAFRHDVLISTTGLEILWREAHERCRGARPGTPDHDLWHQALEKLVVALQEAEGLASATLPSVGRRHWEDRSPEDPPGGRGGSVLHLTRSEDAVSHDVG